MNMALVAKNISKTYGEGGFAVQVLTNVNLELAAGEKLITKNQLYVYDALND